MPENFYSKHIWLFLISMLPIVELRGAVPVGAAMDLPFWEVYLICVLGNILPVPFLILFSKAVLTWLAKIKHIGPFFQRIIDKANAKALTIGKYELIGLCLFVAIPLPGTGAWTGSLVAAILQLRWRQAFLAIAVGVLISGIIMGVISYGAAGLFQFVF